MEEFKKGVDFSKDMSFNKSLKKLNDKNIESSVMMEQLETIPKEGLGANELQEIET